MNKSEFVKCAKALLEYSSWERKLYECGMDLESTPANKMADLLHQLMCDGNPDWAYDTKLEFDWIIEWCLVRSLTQSAMGSSLSLILLARCMSSLYI